MIYNRYKKNRDVKYLNFLQKFLCLFSKMTEKQIYVSKLTKKAIKKFFKNPWLFEAIEIETLNRCNGKCSFCPVSIYNDKREYKKMSDDLFLKIIAELKKINYSGRIALYSNNEPFLDDRICNFVALTRRELPNAFLYLYTNGSLLTLEKYKEVIKSLDELIIDNYNDDLELNENIRIIESYISDDVILNNKTKIHLRMENEVLTTRGGNAPNKTINKPLKMSCILPFTQIIVRPDGKLSLCCNDAYGEKELGDLNKQSIVDAWFGEHYMNVRREIAKGRGYENICSRCDSLFYPCKYQK